MPKVGKKEYAYTPKGMAQAKADAKKKGMKVSYGKSTAKKAAAKNKRHEMTEGPAERKAEYGKSKKGK